MKKRFISIFIAAFLAAAVCIQNGNITYQADAATKSYTETIDVNVAESGLNLTPTLIVEPASFAEVSQSYMSKAASLIFTPDAAMNVTLQEETRSLGELFDEALKGEYIPVIRLDSDTVDGFINWMNDTYTVTDIMAISSEIEVIERLYADEVCKIVNTVYDLTNITIPADRYGMVSYIGNANAAGCNVLLVNGEDENVSVAAEYVSAMTKVCWAYVKDKMQAVNAIAAGCYGVVSTSVEELNQAVSVFKKEGFARAQYLSSHRGITSYANENSLTAVAAAANEGATHVEVDLQISEDGELVLCHDSSTNFTSRPGFYFVTTDLEKLQTLTLGDYTNKYGDTYPTLEEIIELIIRTDLILMLELKLDAASTAAIDELKAIEKLAEVMSKYPEMEGHWFAITFYAPVAEKMRELLPEIPVGFIGGATSGKETDEGKTGWNGGWTQMANVKSKIAFMRKYNTVLDETYETTTDTTAAEYLARGYTQNTWTFADITHFRSKANIATSDAVEQCAMLVKEIGWDKTTLSVEELTDGKILLPCKTYSGWQLEKECELIVVERSESHAVVLPYFYQEGEVASYGIYGMPVEVAIN